MGILYKKEMSEPATEDFLPLVPPSDEQRNEQRIELIKKLKENRIKNMKMQDCKTYDEKISYYESINDNINVIKYIKLKKN